MYTCVFPACPQIKRLVRQKNRLLDEGDKQNCERLKLNHAVCPKHLEQGNLNHGMRIKPRNNQTFQGGMEREKVIELV